MFDCWYTRLDLMRYRRVGWRKVKTIGIRIKIPVEHRTLAKPQLMMLTTTHWQRSLTYGDSHKRAKLRIPNFWFSLSNKTAWSKVSNDALRLSNTKATIFLLSNEASTSIWTLSSAVSVEWNILYADWNLSRRRWCWDMRLFAWPRNVQLLHVSTKLEYMHFEGISWLFW